MSTWDVGNISAESESVGVKAMLFTSGSLGYAALLLTIDVVGAVLDIANPEVTAIFDKPLLAKSSIFLCSIGTVPNRPRSTFVIFPVSSTRTS